MGEYRYGFDLEEDIKELYGDDYRDDFRSKENKRHNLWNNYIKIIQRLMKLDSVIQNPVPISENDYFEWQSIVEKTKSDLNSLFTEISAFVAENHIKD